MPYAPTGAFIGTRVEALQALLSQVKVTSILCLNDSYAHKYCSNNGLKFQTFNLTDREKAMDFLKSLKVDLYLSAGFPWIIDIETLEATKAIKLNSHPSMLPNFPGRNAIRDALRAGSKTIGVTVHKITAEVDAGPIIFQEEILIDGMNLPEIYNSVFGLIEPRVIGKALMRINQELFS
jgi:phosphoribosylglycinamide formyltransferase-1